MSARGCPTCDGGACPFCRDGRSAPARCGCHAGTTDREALADECPWCLRLSLLVMTVPTIGEPTARVIYCANDLCGYDQVEDPVPT